MDSVQPNQRSWMMSRIKGKDTKPELVVRKLVHALGYRFRLHRKDLPGKPDLVLPKLRKVILVHGCFWHRHADCKYAYHPKSNQEFWDEKFDKNQRRDVESIRRLTELGWDVLVVWECETRDGTRLAEHITEFLQDNKACSADAARKG